MLLMIVRTLGYLRAGKKKVAYRTPIRAVLAQSLTIQCLQSA